MSVALLCFLINPEHVSEDGGRTRKRCPHRGQFCYHIALCVHMAPAPPLRFTKEMTLGVGLILSRVLLEWQLQCGCTCLEVNLQMGILVVGIDGDTK